MNDTVRSPRRIVSLVASNTEIVCALGLGGLLVGLDNYSDYPPEVQHLPRVGRDLEIDLEKVAALKPDLVLASLSVPGMERNVAGLEARDIPYVVIKSNGLTGVLESIRQIGQVTGVEQRAEALVAKLEQRIQDVAQRLAGAATVSVYWEWWPRPFIAPGGRSWITDLCRLAGGRNVFADVDRESSPVTTEQVLQRQPEVVVLCWCGAQKLPRTESVAEREGWQQLPAVAQGRCYAVGEPRFGRPGPRLVEGLEELARLLHPEAFGARPAASDGGMERPG